MLYDHRPLLELATKISENIGYASTHLQQLCILEGDIGIELNKLKQDSAWLEHYFVSPEVAPPDSYQEALLTIMRNMLFHVARHPDPLQWQYDSRQHLSMYNAFLLIDSAAKLWHATPSKALNGFAPPFLDDVYRLVFWLLDDFADDNIVPWSHYYTETDRTNELILLDDALTQVQSSERLMGYILYRQDILDHINGNQPIGKTWASLTESSLSTPLYRAMIGYDLEAIPKLLRKLIETTGLSEKQVPFLPL